MNVLVIPLLSVEGQKDLGFHWKYNNLCFKDLAVRRSCGSGMTWGWVINDNFLILGWNNPLSHLQNKSRISLMLKGKHFWNEEKTLLRTFPFIKKYSGYSLEKADKHVYIHDGHINCSKDRQDKQHYYHRGFNMKINFTKSTSHTATQFQT